MIDLHMHTNKSDGNLSPADLMKRCQSKGISLISITDHNNVRAYEDILKPEIRALFRGEIIAGVEIGAMCNGQAIEILGYGFDIAKLNARIDGYPRKDYVAYRIGKMYERLGSLGLDIERELPQKSLNHFDPLMDLLLEKHQPFLSRFGEFHDRNSLYRNGFLNKKSALCLDLSGYYADAVEIVKWIRSAGGLAFIAHPAQYADSSQEVLDTLANSVDGVEVWHHSATPAYEKYLKSFAKQHKIYISGGSDFHGGIKAHIDVGINENPFFWTKNCKKI